MTWLKRAFAWLRGLFGRRTPDPEPPARTAQPRKPERKPLRDTRHGGRRWRPVRIRMALMAGGPVQSFDLHADGSVYHVRGRTVRRVHHPHIVQAVRERFWSDLERKEAA